MADILPIPIGRGSARAVFGDECACADCSGVQPGDDAAGPLLSMWVITQNPSDFPGQFVAREWLIGAGVTAATLNHRVAATLEDIRDLVPPGLAHLPRSPSDDPVIVESWI